MSEPHLNASADCLFCKIIAGKIPCFKVAETTHSLAFLDINPLSKGHILVIPKYHAPQMHEIPDEFLADVLPLLKKVAKAVDAKNYNILQNNGSLAHQVVMHVHFHLIPKPNQKEGLGISWPASEVDKGELASYLKELTAKM
eukprot:TRINITY_DN4121_c0_g1_i1.p1 TRINITY_DN4121_c0_g1~~TRINITY_DN4121_c0_g1_i1.p1  ORF type:complete len:142 (-),score=30.91 TRINITY_DN4121_c0_g1_i1:247-672(-)